MSSNASGSRGPYIPAHALVAAVNGPPPWAIKSFVLISHFHTLSIQLLSSGQLSINRKGPHGRWNVDAGGPHEPILYLTFHWDSDIRREKMAIFQRIWGTLVWRRIDECPRSNFHHLGYYCVRYGTRFLPGITIGVGLGASVQKKRVCRKKSNFS